MELSPGYKRTEVGVVPVEWDVEPIAELSEFVTSGSRGWAKYYSDQGPLFIRSQNVRDGHLDFTDQQSVSLPAGSEGSRTRIKRDDLLITITGNSVGNVAWVDRDLGEAYISQHVGLVRLLDSSLAEFVCLFLAPHSPGNTQILGSQSGQSKPGLNLKNLEDFLIALPSSPERCAITKLIRDMDALLEGLEKLIAKKRDLKQAAMQQLLTGQTRLPGFSGEWDVKTIKEIVETPVTDGPHLTPRFLSDGTPFLSVNNLVDNRIDLQDLRYVSRSDDEIFSRKCKPRRNDILLGKAASVGKVAVVETDLNFNIWSPIALIRVTGDYSARFVYYQFQSAGIIRQIALLTNSSSQGNIGMADIEKLTFRLPTLAEQTAIAAVLTDMDAELEVLEQRLTKTRDLKQAMMQELLTGRTRLVTPELTHA